MPIRDIENHLERADARIARFERIEAIEARREERAASIRIAGGIIDGVVRRLCCLYAVLIRSEYL